MIFNQENNVNKNILSSLCKKEKRRSTNSCNFIASENYMSAYVSSFLSNIYLSAKYAEGYPNNRYYNGCSVIDEIENYAIEQAKTVFECRFANVQSHSGTQANMAVLLQLLKPGDTILSLCLNDGGHLSHGHKANFSGKLFNIENYYLDENNNLNYDHIREIALKTKPKIIICGYSSFSGNIDFYRFSLIAKEVEALLLSDISHISGIVAAKMFNNPFPYSDIVTTTTHKTLRGPRGAIILCNDEHISRNINKSVFPLTQGGAFFNHIAAKAAALEEAQTDEFKFYIHNVLLNSKAMCTVFQQQGWNTYCASTYNHMFLVNTADRKVKNTVLTGKLAADILESAHVIVNKNMMPRDASKSVNCDGIRIGTAAMTTRGMTSTQAIEIANTISDLLSSKIDTRTARKHINDIRKKIL